VVVGSNHCGIGVAQGFPIGRLEHQNRGRTSLGVSVVEAVEHPIGPGGEVPVVEGAIRPHPRDPDEQNLWAEADPMSSFVGVAQVEKCKKAVGPLD